MGEQALPVPAGTELAVKCNESRRLGGTWHLVSPVYSNITPSCVKVKTLSKVLCPQSMF